MPARSKGEHFMDTFDAVIIGSGPAGGTAASRCAAAGLRTALIEQQGFGGTCPLRGCDPKKVLYNAAEAVARTRQQKKRGIASETRIDWIELMRFKRSFTDPVSEQLKREYREQGIVIFRDKARFTGRNTLRAGDRELSGKKILVATGTMPRPLDLPGKEYLVTSDDFLDFDNLPESFLFLGGGYISFELGQVAALAGKQVTIIEMSDQLLGRFDPDLVAMLAEASRDLGIRIETNLTAQHIEKGFLVRAGKDGEREFRADCIVNGAGRIPRLHDLDLEAGEVDYWPKGVTVNTFMQSVSNSDVYAAGDAAATPFLLTPTAAQEGKTAAINMIRGNTVTNNLKGVPSAIFTHPPMAAVGMLESEAREKGFEFETRFADTSSWFNSRSIGLNHSGMKILIERKRRKILGAHLLGHNAEEMINVFALAIRHDLTADDLGNAVYSYPTAVREMRYLLG